MEAVVEAVARLSSRIIACLSRRHREMKHTIEFSVAHVYYGELLLFLLAPITYVNTLQERNVFAACAAILSRVDYRYSRVLVTGGTGLRAVARSR